MASGKRGASGALAARPRQNGKAVGSKRSKSMQQPHASTSRETLESVSGDDVDEDVPSMGGESDDTGSDDFDDDVDLHASLQEAPRNDGDVEVFSDEDMEGGFEDVAEEDDSDSDEESRSNNPAAQPRQKQGSLYAIPTRDEMNQLKNTSELYTSNIFKLKIQEMVAEVRPRYEQATAMETALRKIKAIVDGMPEIEPQVLPIALKKLSQLYKKQDIVVPFPDPQPDAEAQLKYGVARPTHVQIVGSWILQTAARRPGGFDVDVVLTMPGSLFQEKDAMNMRYFHKRAFYLAAVAAAITHDTTLDVDASYLSSRDDPWRPLLIIRAKQDKSEIDFSKLKGFIRIHLSHELGTMAVGRLAPDRNNLRVAGEETSAATPLYNASVLKDSLYTQHLIYLNSIKSRCAAFGEALILLKTWASQRCFGTGPSRAEAKGKVAPANAHRVAQGTGDVRFLLTMILAHLINGPDTSVKVGKANGISQGTSKLSPGSSSFQLFRGVLDYFTSHNFQSQPIFMKATDGVVSFRDRIGTQSFVDTFENVFVDPTGTVNLLASMPTGSVRFLQQEAGATTALLSISEQDHFDDIFLHDLSKPVSRFDELVRISSNLHRKGLLKRQTTGNDGMIELTRTLAQGLSDRHQFVTAFSPAASEWSTNVASPAAAKHTVEIGIRLDAANAFRLVDHGPRPEDGQAAEAFKSFWGEMSELRRFRDGRVVESVVWNVNGLSERHTIPRRIVQYVIKRHYDADIADKAFMSTSFGSMLAPDANLAKQSHAADIQDIGFQGVQNSFDQLSKALRGIEGLPLSLISAVAADSGLRQLSTMVPAPILLGGSASMAASHVPIHDFVMTFESSGHWPDDVKAIHAMKMAFFATIADKVVEVMPGAKASIAINADFEDNDLCDYAAIEIVVPAGFAFRGCIHHDRERVLLQRLAADKDEDTSIRAQAKAALHRYEKRFVHAVRHYDHLGALIALHPSLGEAVRLLKRWISSQLLSNHVSEVLLELIAAESYITASASGVVPVTGHAGFVRILQRLAAWDWREQPLPVPLVAATSATSKASMESATMRQIEANFGHMRRLDPALNHYAWFIATEDEVKGCAWARDAPSAATADAITRLAQGANHILEGGAMLSQAHVKALFVPSLDHFDFLIHLEPAAVNRYLDAVAFSEDALHASQKRLDASTSSASRTSSKYRNLIERHDLHAGLDTGKECVHLLEALFSDSFRLYYDELGGIVVGGLFNPSLTDKTRPFRVGLGFNAQPAPEAASNSKDAIVLNRLAVLDEVRRLGAGLVRDITLQQKI